MKHPRTISIRCIIAIVLMALTIVFLFWPSFFSIKAKNTLSGASAGYSQSFLEYRNDITQMLQDVKQKQGNITPSYGCNGSKNAVSFERFILYGTFSSDAGGINDIEDRTIFVGIY